jgi:hypothetical protein
MENSMTYNIRTAQRLFSGPETELYEQSRKSGLQGLSQKQLQRNISRSRKLHERLARQAGQPRHANPDISAGAALSLEILRRFERHFVHVMMDPVQHNQQRNTPPQVGGKLESTRLGPPTQETRARAQHEVAQDASRRIDGMVASQERRVQNRDDKR